MINREYNSRISIQVSLSGYSFKTEEDGRQDSSGWLGAEKIFTTPEFQKRYDVVDISLMTGKCALVPSSFFSPDEARAALSEVVDLRDSDQVDFVEVPAFGAVLVYSLSIDESLSRLVSQTVLDSDGHQSPVLPEMYFILRDILSCRDYNKIMASYRDGLLHLAIAQGKSLLLSNVFAAQDFTTAQYFIFLAMKKFQLNPEVSTISLRTAVSPEDEMSLYRYFKSVEIL